jgi:hypothetical protein
MVRIQLVEKDLMYNGGRRLREYIMEQMTTQDSAA